VAEGLTDKEIAKALAISTKTVRTHLERLFQRYGWRNRSEAAGVYEGNRIRQQVGGAGSEPGSRWSPEASADWIAACRAPGRHRSEILAGDHMAQLVCGSDGLATEIDEAVSPSMTTVGAFNAVRTRFFDDLMMAASDDGIQQFVVVAYGIDSRALRVLLPSAAVVYELDDPALLERKEDKLKASRREPRCTRRPVPMYLDSDWEAALRRTGYRALERSCWLIEGAVPCMCEPDARALLAKVTSLVAPAGVLGVDFVGRGSLVLDWLHDWRELLAAHGMSWRFAIDDPAELLEPLGWEVSTCQVGNALANCGRRQPLDTAFDLEAVPHSYLVRATRV
jgi:methyltransferase (TIGR00027 family)